MKKYKADTINVGFKTTLTAFCFRVDNLTMYAREAYDYAEALDRAEALESAESDLVRIYKQCVGLCEIWPHREAEFVAQAYDQLRHQITLIMNEHADSMPEYDDNDY